MRNRLASDIAAKSSATASIWALSSGLWSRLDGVLEFVGIFIGPFP
jgi:hypothetical protein